MRAKAHSIQPTRVINISPNYIEPESLGEISECNKLRPRQIREYCTDFARAYQYVIRENKTDCKVFDIPIDSQRTLNACEYWASRKP